MEVELLEVDLDCEIQGNACSEWVFHGFGSDAVHNTNLKFKDCGSSTAPTASRIDLGSFPQRQSSNRIFEFRL